MIEFAMINEWLLLRFNSSISVILWPKLRIDQLIEEKVMQEYFREWICPSFQCHFESVSWIDVVLNQHLVDEYLFPNRYIRMFCSHQGYIPDWIIYRGLHRKWINKIKVLFIYFVHPNMNPNLGDYIKQIPCPANHYNDIDQNFIHLCRLCIVNRVPMSSDQIWHREWMIITFRTSSTTMMLFIDLSYFVTIVSKFFGVSRSPNKQII
jgi:hypothetical protein